MYYQEKVINGIICSKTTPNGEWKELSKEQLTQRILRLENTLDSISFSQ